MARILSRTLIRESQTLTLTPLVSLRASSSVNGFAERPTSSTIPRSRLLGGTQYEYPGTNGSQSAAGLRTMIPSIASSGRRIPRTSLAYLMEGRKTFMVDSRHMFSTNTSHLPAITDPDVESAFKDLMAMNWDEIPDTIINDTKKALNKETDDKAGQEALANVFRAAEASVEFGGLLVSLRMTLDDLSGLTGENVGHLPEYLEGALKAAYKRYMTYLDSFGPDETYLRRKVETELGTKMIHLKMRCSGIGSEWGKITLLGTSGLSGSYVELRA